jgi:outer membrane protein
MVHNSISFWVNSFNKSELNLKIMRKIGFLFGLMLLTSAVAVAQKYAFVDSEYIRKNIPAFTTAQEQLDKLSKQWEKEVADGYAVVEQMYKSYQNDAVLLSQEMKTKREEAIITKEKEMKELQNKYFGMEGELFKKREELVKPIQDEILKAIKEMAVEGSYAVIFDTAAGGNILFANPKYDLSDQVLEKLGYKN